MTFTPGAAGGKAAGSPRSHDPADRPVIGSDPVLGRARTDDVAVPTDRVAALDGIRGLAVTLVVLFHLGVPGMSGGFLGVDVFFVLSGFLITTLLLRDIVSNGRIDLARFWARRMARLMPAVLLLFLAVGIWSLSAAPVFRRAGLGADLLWCLLYVGNWHFISTSSYFVFDGTTSPLLHLWSLGVEEQFYLIWPLILQAVALLLAGVSTGRHASRDIAGARNRSTTAVMITGGLLGVVSVILAVQTYVGAGPDRSYMGTDTKVFEPLIGAICAAATLRPRVGALVRRHAQAFIGVGVVGVLAMVMLLGSPAGPRPAYYFGGAVATALAAVALVAGGAGADPTRGAARLLATAAVAYVGRISYGIYLWHWPWTLWLLPDGQFEAVTALFAVAATVATAAASYHLLEVPLRTGRFRLAPPVRILRTGIAGMAGTAVVPVLLGATPWYPGTATTAAGAAAAPPTRLLLVGDSVPLQLYGSFATAGEQRDIVVINGAHGGCSASGVVTVNPDGSPYNPLIPRMPGAPDGPICGGVASDQQALVTRERPTLVLWWSRYEVGDFVGPDGRPVRAGEPGYRDMQRRLLDASVDRLGAGGATVVVVQPEPTGVKTADRCTPDRRDEPAGECGAFLVRLRFDDQVRQQWIDILREKAATDRRLRLIRVDDLFCRTQANPCDDRLPLAENGAFGPPTAEQARPDGSHFAPEIRDRVAADVLRRALDAAVSAPH